MRFWSKGLGKRSMAMDCGKETVAIGDQAVVLSGRVRPPLGWAYTITMDGDDWLDFIELTLHPAIIRYLLRRRRMRLAMKAAWHLAWLYASVARRTALVWLKAPKTVNAPQQREPE